MYYTYKCGNDSHFVNACAPADATFVSAMSIAYKVDADKWVCMWNVEDQTWDPIGPYAGVKNGVIVAAIATRPSEWTRPDQTEWHSHTIVAYRIIWDRWTWDVKSTGQGPEVGTVVRYVPEAYVEYEAEVLFVDPERQNPYYIATKPSKGSPGWRGFVGLECLVPYETVAEATERRRAKWVEHVMTLDTKLDRNTVEIMSHLIIATKISTTI